MLKGFNREYFEYKDGVLICDDEVINIEDIKAIYIDTTDSAVHSDTGKNIFLVRIKMKDGTVIRASRTATQHYAVETLQKLYQILKNHGEFQQYGSSVLNMSLVHRAMLSNDENRQVTAVFKDSDTIIIVNTPFPRVARSCLGKLQSDIAKYRAKHRISVS